MKREVDSCGNTHSIYKQNKVRVIKLIRDHQAISRAGIAKKSGLSAPTVSRIVEDLIADGLVQEIGEGESHGGRRPMMLEFSGKNNFIIGIDLGTTSIYGALSDFDAEIYAEIRIPTKAKEGFPEVMKRTSRVIDELMDRKNNLNGKIFGIGMAVAGLVNRKRNIVEFSPNFRWHCADVAGELAGNVGLPIFFDNVTRVMAFGEMCYGVGKSHKNFICINVGYGIGAGIVVEGIPLYGTSGMAGEFGHIILEKESRIACDCGNFGCLESLASGNAIAKAACRELESGARSILRDMCGGDFSQISAEMVADAAKQGDSLAWAVFNRAVEYLGVGIAGLINLFSPEVVVIGGGVAESGDILFDKVRKTVNARALKKIASGVDIRPATFGMKAAVMGAISLVLMDVIGLGANHLG